MHHVNPTPPEVRVGEVKKGSNGTQFTQSVTSVGFNILHIYISCINHAPPAHAMRTFAIGAPSIKLLPGGVIP